MKNTSEAATNRIVGLVLKEQREGLSPAEQQELDHWSNASKGNQQFIDRCKDREQVIASLLLLEEVGEEAAWVQKYQQHNTRKRSVLRTRRRGREPLWMTAVWMGLVITGIAVMLFRYMPLLNRVSQVPPKEDRLPGTQGATLTLADGRVVELKDLQDGQLALGQKELVSKRGNELIYEAGAAAGSRERVAYHAVTTAVGGFYALTLPDKTKVWLNAASRIRYPTQFMGRQRRVEVSGEAYFEVVSNVHQPFVVVAGPVEVKVVGTHFNVRNYQEDNAIRVTLLEGVVQVKAGKMQKGRKKCKNKLKASAILKPGQQAILTLGDEAGKIKLSQLVVQQADIPSVMAWKSGYFDFKASFLSDIMHDIKRWYPGIDSVDMQVAIPDKFTATIPRYVSLSGLLAILQATSKVKCSLQGNTIRVTR